MRVNILYYIKSSKKPLDKGNTETTMYKDTQLPNQSHKPILNRIDQEQLQESLVNKELPNKICYSKSTQTENLSVLYRKNNLPKNYNVNRSTCANVKCSKISSIHRSSLVSLK